MFRLGRRVAAASLAALVLGVAPARAAVPPRTAGGPPVTVCTPPQVMGPAGICLSVGHGGRPGQTKPPVSRPPGEGGGIPPGWAIDPMGKLVQNPCPPQLMNPQPPTSDPIWQGHTDGAIYSGACWVANGRVLLGPWIRWMAAAPPTVTPAELAQQAFAALTLPTPRMHRSPDETNQDAGMPFTWVNLWTWYWTDAASWRTLTRTVTAGPVWATVTVRPAQLVLDPGNGQPVTTCAGPGRAWTEADANRTPSGGGCGVRYTSVSQGVTSTLSIRWSATWVGSGGASGTLPVLITSTSSRFRVEQIQVVNR